MNNDVNTNEQTTQIYDEVRKIAEKLTEIQATCTATNQKEAVIGKALVDQKATVGNLADKCDAIYGQQQEYLSDTKAHQEATSKNMTGVLQIATQMGQVDARQQELLESLGSLRSSQEKFVESNLSHSKAVSKKLLGINTLLKEVQTSIDNLDVEDQVAFINDQVSQIETILSEYKQAQSATHEAITNQMAITDARVRGLSEDIRGQFQMVANIEQSAKAYEDKTMEMCDKFNTLLIQYQAIEETKDISLEEMFIKDEPTPEPIPEKKKGLLSKMFGGK